MNRAYRSIYNERTGTFVAVAEHSKARGKKSSSAKQIATAATLGVSLLMGGPALADIVLDEAQNKIEFTQAGGTIDFGNQGQIKGLQQLSVSGVLDANQVLVNSAEPLTNTSRYVVTGAQLYATNQNVAQLNQSLSQTTQSLTQTADRLAQTDTALDQLEAQVVQHENQLVDHSTQLANHETQLTQQATTIQSIETTLLDAGIDANTPGVKYFRTNSQAADAQALGAESIAIGPQAKAVGDSSIALGEASQSAANKSMALGSQASVDSEFATRSIAIGQSAKVTGNSEDALAIGSAAQAQDRAALAIGHEANAQSVNSLALGSAAKASAANTVALGAGASAEADGNVAIGLEAGVGSNLGPVTPGLDRTNQVMIGTRAGQSIEGNQNTAIGFEAGNNTTSNYFVAIGNQAGQGLKGNENISVGHQANKQATGTPIEHAISIGSKTEAGSFSVVLGEQAKASSTNTVAIGQQTKVSGAYGVALGAQAQASGSSVALGARSVATTSSGRGFLTDFNADLNSINVVSLGQAGQERRLTHVAAGSVDTDGVNVSQLRAAQSNLADLLGDGVMDANGKITGFKVNGNTYQSVAQVIGELNAGGLTPQLPAGAVMYTADSTATNSKINLQGTEGTVISNLAMAANPDDNDAVNVAYLNQQLSENQVHYISVNSQEATNRNNNEANGLNSIAIGPDTVTSGTAASSVAIGHSALAADLAAQSVVLGNAVTADQQRSVVIGVESHTYGTSNIAIGDDAHSHGANSIVIGQNAKVDPKIPGGDSDNGIALGTKAKVSAESGTAIGHDATASALHASALGFEAYATGTRSSALGSQANASGADSFAQGTLSVASAQNSQAQGTQARATATDGIAMGTEAVSGMLNPDPNQQVNNINTIAIGKSASASFKNAMATGTQAQATHENTIASGFQAEATAGNAMALGANAKAAHERAVALGEGAQTSAAVSTTGATIDKKDYVYAGQQPIATVSVGSAGNERTITHVAAGRVSATSTDAINGSQLYGAHVAINDLGDDLDTAGQSVADALGGGSSYNPNTHKVTASLNVQGNTYTTVNEAINYAAQGWSLTAHGVAGAEAIKPGGTANFSSGKNIVVERTGNTITYKTADDVEFNQVQVDNSITIGDDITNQTVINQGSVSTTNLTVTGETKLGDHFSVTNQGDVHYDGPITDATHIVNKEYVDTAEAGLTAKGMNFVGSDGQVIHKDLGDTLGIVGGLAAGAAASSANITTVQNANGELEIQLAKNLTDLDTVQVDNSITIGDDVTNQTVINQGSVSTTNLTVTGETKLGDHFSVTNQGDVHYDGPITDATHIVNKEYVDQAGDELTTKGMNFVGSDGQVIHKDLGDTLGIVGGLAAGAAASSANITTVQNANGELEIQLAKNLTDLDTVQVDNSVTIGDDLTNQTVINQGSVSTTNLTVTGETKLGDHFTVTSQGDVHYDGPITDATHIVNKEYVDTAEAGLTAKGMNFVGNDGQVIHKDLGDTLGIVGGLAAGAAASSANITTVQNANGELEIQLAKNLTDLDTVQVDNSVTIGDDITNQTVINQGSVSTTNLTVTGETKLGDHFSVTNQGDVHYDGPITDATHIVNKEYVDTAEAGLTAKGMNFVGSDGQVIHKDLGDTLGIVGGLAAGAAASSANITTVQNANGELEIQLAKNLTDLDTVQVDNSITIGDDLTNQTVINQGSVSTTNLTVTGETKLGDHFSVTNQGDVHYDGPITDATHIVNKEYVDQASDELTTKGMNFVGSDGQVIHKDLGDTLGIVGGLAAGAAASSANITTVQNANGELEIQLAKNLTDLDTVQVDNSITIGDDLTNQTVINQGSVSTTNLTVTGETKLGDHFTVTNQGDVHYDGPITDATHIVNKEYLTQELGTAIAGSGWYVSTGKGADKAESYVAPQQEVNVVNNDSNLALSQKDIIEQDADGNDVVVGQQLGFDLAHTVQIGAKELDGSVGDNPQVVIGEDGAGQGVPGITVPASGNGQGAVTIGGGDVTIDWIDQAGQKTPIAVGDTLMKGLNFSGNNYAATDADSIVNKKFGERLEILGVDWIETEVKDGAIYIKLADNFPVVPKPGDNAGGSTPGGGNTPGGEGNGGTPAPGDGLGNIVAGGDIQGGNNINVKPGEGDHSLIIETTPDVEHNSVTVGDVVINQDGIHAGNTQITGVANGTKNDHAVNLGQLKDSIHQLDQDLTQKGMNFADSNGDSLHRDLGETLHIVGANDNITTRVDQKGILEIALSDDLNVDSITINNGGPIIDVNGIDMSNTTIKNVAAGVEEGDAVNVGQLHDVRDNLQGQVNVMRRDMHRIDRRLRGGVAAAMATASLPQAYLPGKSMMAISGGTWAGESGVAIGYSGISDNGKWIMKLSGNSSSRGDYGGAVGVGYQW